MDMGVTNNELMTTSAAPSLDTALPRNAVEMPLYGFLRWKVWAPPRVLLSLVSRDVDDRLAGLGYRVVAIDRETQRDIDPDLTYTKDVPTDDLKDAGLRIENMRLARPGPRRAAGSMQLILDIGIHETDSALASMLLWRDLAIELGNLLVGISDPTSGFFRLLEARRMAVRKQRQRIRDAGWTGKPCAQMPLGVAERRVAAVVCARAAAARCGGASADQLLSDALKRYAAWDDELHLVELPDEDMWGYHPTGRPLAKWFVKPGGKLYEYNEVLTEVRQRRAPRPSVSR